MTEHMVWTRSGIYADDVHEIKQMVTDSFAKRQECRVVFQSGVVVVFTPSMGGNAVFVKFFGVDQRGAQFFDVVDAIDWLFHKLPVLDIFRP